MKFQELIIKNKICFDEAFVDNPRELYPNFLLNQHFNKATCKNTIRRWLTDCMDWCTTPDAWNFCRTFWYSWEFCCKGTMSTCLSCMSSQNVGKAIKYYTENSIFRIPCHTMQKWNKIIKLSYCHLAFLVLFFEFWHHLKISQCLSNRFLPW